MKELKISGLSTEETSRLIPHTPVLVGYVGSIAHDMYIPQNSPDSIDDKDIMGVVLGPAKIYIGLSKFEGRNTFLNEYDCVVYEFRKYIRLLQKCNPNVMSLLWLRPENYIYKSGIGELLVNKRYLFSSKLAYKSFTGYAYSQLHRMTHYKYEGYMGKKRKALIDKFGFDVKNAAHLIRLLRMGIEFLNEGILYVARHDREQLLEIKRGEWSLEEVKEEATRLFHRAETAYDNCKLPATPDYDAIEELTMEIVYDHINTLVKKDTMWREEV